MELTEWLTLNPIIVLTYPRHLERSKICDLLQRHSDLSSCRIRVNEFEPESVILVDHLIHVTFELLAQIKEHNSFVIFLTTWGDDSVILDYIAQLNPVYLSFPLEADSTVDEQLIECPLSQIQEAELEQCTKPRVLDVVGTFPVEHVVQKLERDCPKFYQLTMNLLQPGTHVVLTQHREIKTKLAEYGFSEVLVFDTFAPKELDFDHLHILDTFAFQLTVTWIRKLYRQRNSGQVLYYLASSVDDQHYQSYYDRRIKTDTNYLDFLSSPNRLFVGPERLLVEN